MSKVNEAKSLNTKYLTQQGDVLCFGGESIPEGAKPIKIRDGNIILAEGERTGHYHAVEANPAEVEGFEHDGTIYLNVKVANVTVKHQEHKPITLKQGQYKIGIVRELDPFQEVIHRVAD